MIESPFVPVALVAPVALAAPSVLAGNISSHLGMFPQKWSSLTDGTLLVA